MVCNYVSEKIFPYRTRSLHMQVGPQKNIFQAAEKSHELHPYNVLKRKMKLVSSFLSNKEDVTV